LFHSSAKSALGFFVLRVVREIFHAIGVVGDLIQFFFWSFAEAHLVEGVFRVSGVQVREVAFGGGSVCVAKSVFWISGRPEFGFYVENVEEIFGAYCANGIREVGSFLAGPANVVSFLAEERVSARGIDPDF